MNGIMAGFGWRTGAEVVQDVEKTEFPMVSAEPAEYLSAIKGLAPVRKPEEITEKRLS
jgi:hypothetical protein